MKSISYSAAGEDMRVSEIESDALPDGCSKGTITGNFGGCTVKIDLSQKWELDAGMHRSIIVYFSLLIHPNSIFADVRKNRFGNSGEEIA